MMQMDILQSSRKRIDIDLLTIIGATPWVMYPSLSYIINGCLWDWKKV